MFNNLELEYNAFGPWVYEIGESHPVPPLFEAHVNFTETHLMLIKVPIDEERRNLKPGMNMYDYVIGLYDSYIHILKKNGEEVSEFKIPYSSVEAVKQSINLLRGEVHIFTSESDFVVVYNNSSEDVMHKLVKIIRGKITPDEDSMEMSRHEEVKDDFCFLFNSLILGIEKRETNFRIIGHQEERNIKFTDKRLLKKLVQLLMVPYLGRSLHIINNRELIIISCGNERNYRRHLTHKYSYLYIPVSNITKTAKRNSSEFMNVCEYSINTLDHEFIVYGHENDRGLAYIEKLKI